MTKKIVNMLLAISMTGVMLCGCDKGKPEVKDISLIPDESTQTVVEVPNEDEDIPPIADIMAMGTEEYNERAFKEKGFNELAGYYNQLVAGFNEINKLYSDDTVPQSDEIEEQTAALAKKIEEVNESIGKAKTYGDAIAAIGEIEELEKEVEELTESIERSRVTKQ